MNSSLTPDGNITSSLSTEGNVAATLSADGNLDATLAIGSSSGSGLTEEEAANVAKIPEIEATLETKADSANVYTKTEVDTKIAEAQLEGSEVDLSGYATKTELEVIEGIVSTKANTSDIPTTTSQLTNDSGFLTSIPEEYVTETELAAKGYLTEHQDLTEYAKTSDIPTTTSQLTNDSGFLTSIPEEYVTETEMNEAIGGTVDLTGYATTTQVNELKATVDSLHDVANEYVSNGGTVVQFSNDVDGELINCHGMGIMYYNGVYYAYGESKTGETVMGSSGYEFIATTGINCYSSTDLINWKFENKVIKPNEDDSSSIIHTSKVMERPKCVYNKKNNNFVLLWHTDNEAYTFSQIGFATCDTPTGDFTVLGSARPTTNATTCRDFTVFVDDDDKAYAFIAQDGNSNMYGHLLNDDYTGFTTTYAQVIGGNSLREAPAVFKYNGEYYILSSGCTGWNPNPSKIHKSSTILGTYEEQNDPCKNDTDSNSYGSQSTYVIKVDPSKFNCEYIACFDQWNKTDLEASTYLWLPLTIDESDNNFYVDNVTNNVIQHLEAVKNRQHLISDPSNYFFNKTIDQALQTLYEMIANISVEPSEPVVATAINVLPSTATVYTGKSKTFTCTITPTAATSTTSVEWSIDNGNATIVTSEKTCTLTGVTAGSVTLTATAGDLTSSANITIEEATTPANRVFAINPASYNAESNTLTDLDNDLVATLVGTPTVTDDAINFTTSDTFSFDISSLELTDFTLKIVYQYDSSADSTANILTVGEGDWLNSFTIYNRYNYILLNGDNATVSNNTVGGTNMSSITNFMGDTHESNTDIEFVLSYNATTRAIRAWVDGTLTQDGIMSKQLYSTLSKLCNTEGSDRFAGAYKLIELYNLYNEEYPS